MNDAPLPTEMSASSFSGICWPPGRGHEDVADRVRVVAILRLEPDDEVELLLLLHDLRRDVAADGGLDEAVDVGDVDPVARDLGAIDCDRQARLAELLDQRHVADAAHVLEHRLDRLALLLRAC